MSPRPHLILIDGSGYIFRAFHALPPMTRPDGTPVNAVFGFTNMLAKFIAEHAGDRIAVVFDKGRRTFRNDIYPDYKAHRPDPPAELVPQFGLIREAVDAFGLPAIEAEGFEADDLIAAYAKAELEEGGTVTIVSSDKDLMQLIRPGVTLLDPIKQKPIGEAEVVEKFGVRPEKVVDVQALAGDATDNVPGVPGIGVKTAAALIEEFGDLETLLAKAETIRQPKRREALIGHAEAARISKRLVTLDPSAPLPLPLAALDLKPPDRAKLAAWLKAQNFRSTLQRLGLDGAGEAAAAPAAAPPRGISAEAPFGPYETVTSEERLRAWIAEAAAQGLVAFDTETDSLDAQRARLVGVSLATAPGRACYVPLRHLGRGADLAADPAPQQIRFETAIALLRPLLEDASVLKVMQNGKYDLAVLARAENGAIALGPIDDTMLMSFCLDAGRWEHGMDQLSARHLGHEPISYDAVTGTGKARVSFAEVPLERATAYAAEDADVTLRLWRLLKPRLRAEQVLALYEHVERRLIPVIAAMERAGVKVDARELRQISAEFADRLRLLEQEIHDLAGRPFTVGSPQQLGRVLFDELKLSPPGGRRAKTATGQYATDAGVLEELATQHPLPGKVLEWRQLAKLKSTYADALVDQIDPATGRIHTSFMMTGAATGRLASTDPNLQNIPVRTEEGRRIRRAFVAEEGHLLLSADYSQIELRLLAHVAEVPALREAFAKGEDIHARTAAEVFGVPMQGMDPVTRRKAKAINFGIIYGISAFGLANQLAITPGEAKAYIDAYFQRYPGIRDYMERMKEEARMRGYVTTPFGRRIWIPGIGEKNPARRGFAERQAINAPLQGGAADVIKRAMVRLPRALAEAGLSARMLLQVHDELLFEVPEAERDATAEVVKRTMEGAAAIRVPLVVEIGSGRNWAEAH
ncbi:DNA polymerase I [Elioraea sp.]|uniref:DNA polymerase I n=1 Tax=Elioraea sp. TaxID=2185103 RepID=UPI0021DDB383|nr:DNA polymerase I [Elioraea sp.]GIX10227.1 MAG: DNA polymerase I [Elioraea sp.]